MENSLSSSIARQCFVFGGPLVFLARSMYYTAIGTVDNRFQDYCLENYGSYKTDPTVASVIEKKWTLQIHPNPTSALYGFSVKSSIGLVLT